jgi:4,5-DOPA dioxygenase extradiol
MSPEPRSTRFSVKLLHPVAANNEPVHAHRSRGLDHGAWVPLKIMYPYADVPVLQLSVPTEAPDRLLELGRNLRALREEGVLVIGSGFMTHGLPYLTPDMFINNSVPSWSSDFDQWAADALDRGDVDTLAAYKDKAPGVRYAHPTVEHYIPLFVTLGAASTPEQPVQNTVTGYRFGLSRRSFQVA